MIRISVLVDNLTESRDLKAEHGLSMFIQTSEKKILFDTGQSSLFLKNSIKMGIDLSDTDIIVLSHCHYDHTKGMSYIIDKDIINSATLYTHPDIFRNCYRVKDKKIIRNIGVSFEKQQIKMPIKLNTKPEYISENIILTGEVPRITEFEDVFQQKFFTGDNDNLIKDDMRDDQSLIIKTLQGLIIVLGCSHAGVINIIKHAIHITGINKIYAVIGGMHLKSSDKKTMERTIKELKKFNIINIIPMHCTGFKASAALYSNMEERFIHACTGSILKF